MGAIDLEKHVVRTNRLLERVKSGFRLRMAPWSEVAYAINALYGLEAKAIVDLRTDEELRKLATIHIEFVEEEDDEGGTPAELEGPDSPAAPMPVEPARPAARTWAGDGDSLMSNGRHDEPAGEGKGSSSTTGSGRFDRSQPRFEAPSDEARLGVLAADAVLGRAPVEAALRGVVPVETRGVNRLTSSLAGEAAFDAPGFNADVFSDAFANRLESAGTTWTEGRLQRRLSTALSDAPGTADGISRKSVTTHIVPVSDSLTEREVEELCRRPLRDAAQGRARVIFLTAPGSRHAGRFAALTRGLSSARHDESADLFGTGGQGNRLRLGVVARYASGDSVRVHLWSSLLRDLNKSGSLANAFFVLVGPSGEEGALSYTRLVLTAIAVNKTLKRQA